ncbi:MAG TPA: glycosyltransferase family 39 protein [Steroidobacteraceae bacterium]
MPKSPLISAHQRPAIRSRGGAWPVIVLLALAPLWLLGIFDRGLWTPDEPREADIAWRMSQQTDHAIPHLADAPFLEKPPLTYWLSAAATTLFGDSAGMARLPNLLYAVIVALAIGTLAFDMAGRGAAVIAALAAGSALLAYRVAIWLAPDAALLAGCAVALLGTYRGYTASSHVRKLSGYTLMHAGAAFGFMAKSAPGWLVPALVLGSLIVWERRWSELKRWELYAGGLLQVLLIGLWISAVVASTGGAESLRVFLWDNIVGRFTALAATPQHNYSQGHLNWWGKYLFELPLYLLPWTMLAAAALARAWSAIRPGAANHVEPARRTAWRFAVSACVPFLALLSLAATARDVYAAPAMLGFALLIALWSCAMPTDHARIDALAFVLTRVLVALLGAGFAIALGILAIVAESGVESAVYTGAAVAVVALTVIAFQYAARLQRIKKYAASIIASYAGYALALVVSGALVLPVVDTWQDLPALAQRIEHDAGGGALAVLNPDETTIAMLDYRAGTTFAALTAAPPDASRVITDWLHAHGGGAHVLVMLPGHARGAVLGWLSRHVAIAAPDDGAAGTTAAAGGAQITGRYQLPQGRRYALLGESAP